MLSKSEETQSPQDWIDSDLLPALRKKYDNVILVDGELGGLEAFVLEFEDRAPKPAKEKDEEKAEDKKEGSSARLRPSQDPPGDDKKDDKSDQEEPFKPLKHRSYILVGVSNAYELRGSFELAEFNTLLPDLDWVSFSFEKILRNRW